MNFKKFAVIIGLLTLTFIACKNDDDGNGIISVPIRDRAEQQIADDQLLKDYLQTHFYTLVDNPANPNYQIMRFDTIAGDNSDKTPIWDAPELVSKSVSFVDEDDDVIDYTLYVLDLRRGVGITDQKSQPTRADSTFVTYRGELLFDNEDKDGDGIPDEADVDADGDGQADQLNGVTRTDRDGDGIADDADADDDGVPGTDSGKVDTDMDGIIDDKDPVDDLDLDRRVFDSAVTPIWFDLVSLIRGFSEAIIDYKSASSLDVNPDNGNIVSSDDFGQFTVFIPSGLGYFSSSAPGGGVPLYSSLIFNVQLYKVNEADHDRDGIPSHLEDLDGDNLVLDIDDDIDEDGLSSYIDADDDGDGTPTRDEITVLGDLNNDGAITLDEITFYDDDGDGTPNHRDPDDKDFKND